MSDEAPILTGEILLDLHREGVNAATEAAELRGEYAQRVKSLGETHGLNGKAFRMASQVRKIENGKREHFIRDLLHYMDLMDCNQQKDILDSVADSNAGKMRTDLEKELDGHAVSAAADDKGKVVDLDQKRVEAKPEDGKGSRLNGAITPGSAMGRRHLSEFKSAIDVASDRTAVTTGLERFCTDHPKLADDAARIAKERIEAIAGDQSGGEDLRPDALRKNEAAEADQAADAGKRKARQSKAKAAEGDGPRQVH